MLKRERRSTTNRFICALAYWFWESHTEQPRSVYRVYGLREYFTRSGHHVWVEEGSNLRTLWRAVGVIFPACKKLWDSIEKKIWEPRGSSPNGQWECD